MYCGWGGFSIETNPEKSRVRVNKGGKKSVSITGGVGDGSLVGGSGTKGGAIGGDPQRRGCGTVLSKERRCPGLKGEGSQNAGVLGLGWASSALSKRTSIAKRQRRVDQEVAVHAVRRPGVRRKEIRKNGRREI